MATLVIIHNTFALETSQFKFKVFVIKSVFLLVPFKVFLSEVISK